MAYYLYSIFKINFMFKPQEGGKFHLTAWTNTSDGPLCFINKHSSSNLMLEAQVKETCQSKLDSQWKP